MKTGLPVSLSLYFSGPICLSVPLLPSAHIIMSGRQISTTAIVGPSVYLLSRKDSLCCNRLISLPPEDFNLFSTENRNNHSCWWSDTFSTVARSPLSTPPVDPIKKILITFHVTGLKSVHTRFHDIPIKFVGGVR